MADVGVLALGPRNPKLLYKQQKHVSGYVWNGQPDRILNLRRPKCPLNGVPPQIEELVRQAGFYEVALAGSIKSDKVLISALVERWRLETHTFHMPFGECTITLQDVVVHLGLNIDGRPITGATWCDWSDLVHRTLGVIPPSRAIRGSGLNLKWLNQLFDFDNLRIHPEQTIFAARAFILRLIGCLLFPDHTGSHVPLRYLVLLEDFDQISSYSWGSGVLALLYHELCHATGFERAEIGGCTYLLQLWAWERIPGIAPHTPAPVFHPGCPLSSRWNAHVGQKHQIEMWRMKLDELKSDDVS